ncbi:MAG TPA: helix-turn-helix domain-containing protein [Ruminiclostridium sp.]
MTLGRPTLYKEEYIEKVYKLCLLGAKDTEIADFFGVSESTLNLWKLEYQDFSESIKRGKINADANVASKLYNRAIGYEHPETITASFQGQITDTMEVTKHYAPDPTAAIFWLKNRQPKQWRDKQEIESVNVNTNITTDLNFQSFMKKATEEEIAKGGQMSTEEIQSIIDRE